MTTLTQAQMDHIVDEHFRYEREDDVEGVLSTLVDDVDHDVVGSPLGPLTSKEQARTLYEGLYADFDGHKITTLRRYYGDGFLVDESLWEGVARGAPLGIPGNGKPLAFRLLHIFEITDDGAIQRENVWMDSNAIVTQLTEE